MIKKGYNKGTHSSFSGYYRGTHGKVIKRTMDAKGSKFKSRHVIVAITIEHPRIHQILEKNRNSGKRVL